MNGGGAQKYYGKYRGTVINNVDPLRLGRIQVIVPDVSIIPSTWAMPCFPVAGKQMGLFTMPQIGSGVWVEFEHGDSDFPIWTGCFVGLAAEVPNAALLNNPASPGIVMQTTLQNAITILDLPPAAPPAPLTGGIMLRSTTGASIVVNDVGIFLDNGKGASIKMVGPTITINNGALMIV